jgi:hypothetical protein
MMEVEDLFMEMEERIVEEVFWIRSQDCRRCRVKRLEDHRKRQRDLNKLGSFGFDRFRWVVVFDREY